MSNLKSSLQVVRVWRVHVQINVKKVISYVMIRIIYNVNMAILNSILRMRIIV